MLARGPLLLAIMPDPAETPTAHTTPAHAPALAERTAAAPLEAPEKDPNNRLILILSPSFAAMLPIRNGDTHEENKKYKCYGYGQTRTEAVNQKKFPLPQKRTGYPIRPIHKEKNITNKYETYANSSDHRQIHSKLP